MASGSGCGSAGANGWLTGSGHCTNRSQVIHHTDWAGLCSVIHGTSIGTGANAGSVYTARYKTPATGGKVDRVGRHQQGVVSWGWATTHRHPDMGLIGGHLLGTGTKQHGSSSSISTAGA